MPDMFNTFLQTANIGPAITVPTGAVIDYHHFAQVPMRVTLVAGYWDLAPAATARLIAFGGKADHTGRTLRKLPPDNTVATLSQPEPTDKADFLVTAASDYGCIAFEIIDQERRRQTATFSVDLALRNPAGDAYTPDSNGEYNIEINAGDNLDLTWFKDFRNNVKWMPPANVGCSPDRGPQSTITCNTPGVYQIELEYWRTYPDRAKDTSIFINLTVV